jgi:anti-sigma B factor antagonist
MRAHGAVVRAEAIAELVLAVAKKNPDEEPGEEELDRRGDAAAPVPTAPVAIAKRVVAPIGSLITRPHRTARGADLGAAGAVWQGDGDARWPALRLRAYRDARWSAPRLRAYRNALRDAERDNALGVAPPGREELMQDDPLRFFAKRRSSRDRVVIELGGECDAATLDELNAVLREVVAEQPSEVVVDLKQVTFLDSLTLGSLTAAAKQVRTGGGAFHVIGADASEVRRAFEITGLDSYLFIPAQN